MEHLIEVIEGNLQGKLYSTVHYLKNGEQDEMHSYEKIIANAKQLAGYFIRHYKAQSRIILIYPQGVPFISALLGCFYAGMIAVPAYPLQNPKHAYRLHKIISSCEPSLILGTDKTIAELLNIKEFEQCPILSSDVLLSTSSDTGFNIASVRVTNYDLAFLQYTSGSTGQPKGVKISHQNLIHNLLTLKSTLGLGKKKAIVTWLPFQHDLGLIVGILSSLYNGNKLVIMPPVSVVQRPYLWLKALSDYQAYFTAGPNFAYQLCVDKISIDLLSTLDLSSVGYALAAAEPNRFTTLAAFCDKFSACGFKKEAYCVGYGLAENTLQVTGNQIGVVSKHKKISRIGLGQNKVEEPKNKLDVLILMGAGLLEPQHKVLIVDPQTHTCCHSDEIGEIWVHSLSSAQGYWDDEEKSNATFKATINGEEGYYLRTGDLGFIDKDELYVTGRLKDLIIVNGHNIYPQDIEEIVEQCHPAIKKNCVAAFSLDINEKDVICVCAEVTRAALKKDNSELLACIRHAIATEFAVEVADIKLLVPGHSFRTTSGKIRRKETKQAYLNNDLVCIKNDVGCNKTVASYCDDKEKLRAFLCEVLEVDSVDDHSTLWILVVHQYMQKCCIKSFKITMALDIRSRKQLLLIALPYLIWYVFLALKINSILGWQRLNPTA